MARRKPAVPAAPSPEVRPNAEALQARTFDHPAQRRAVDQVVNAVTRPGGQQFIAVYGPPGSGKTKTCEIVENVLAHHWRAELEADPNVCPVIRVEAPSAVGREFAWREFLVELLVALGDPAVDRLVGAEALGGKVPTGGIRPGRLGANELLRIAVRRYRARRVRVLLIDESQHMAVAPGLAELRRNLDILKGFANKTGVRIVLFGTYELLEFHRASAQLARRILDVELPRYRWGVAHERRAFELVAREMLGAIAGLDEATIGDSIESCYERSLGCIGELRDWLVQAEHEFRVSGRTWAACLAGTAASTTKSNEMFDEIETLERRVREPVGGRDRLRLRLGLAPLARSVRSTTPAPTTRASGRRPGRRSPVRDRAGVAE